MATVEGDLRFLDRPGGPVDPGWVVVGLVPRTKAIAVSGPGASAAPLVIVTRTEVFHVDLEAVPLGRPVVLANEGPLAHKLFSASLGSPRSVDLPPGTRSLPIELPAVGPIRFYCSLHADETFVLFAAGVRHVQVVSSGGGFRLGSVAAGRYTLTVWGDRVSGPVREVVVDGYSRMLEPVWIDPDLLRPADRPPAGTRSEPLR